MWNCDWCIIKKSCQGHNKSSIIDSYASEVTPIISWQLHEGVKLGVSIGFYFKILKKF